MLYRVSIPTKTEFLYVNPCHWLDLVFAIISLCTDTMMIINERNIMHTVVYILLNFIIVTEFWKINHFVVHETIRILKVQNGTALSRECFSSISWVLLIILCIYL